MKIAEHMTRIAEFERGLARLDAVSDTEIYVVFLMRAGTARVNAALHALALTSDVPGGGQGKLGDLNHTYKPKLEAALPPDMQRAFENLAFLENLRPEFVRGPRVADAALAEACSRAYAEIVARTGVFLNARRSA